MDDRYVGKKAWMSLFTPPNRPDGPKVRTGVIVGADPMGLWIEQPDVEVDGLKAALAHVLIRWDRIDELVVFYEGARSPADDDAPVGFR